MLTILLTTSIFILILINGFLIFLLYRAYRLYQIQEVEKNMLKAMCERDKCKSNNFSNDLNEDEYDFPDDLIADPKVMEQRPYMSYMTGERYTEEEFSKMTRKKRGN